MYYKFLVKPNLSYSESQLFIYININHPIKCKIN